MSDDYNPASTDAMFSKILARLEEQDRAAERREREITQRLDEICEQTTLTNGRVTKLELAHKHYRGVMFGIASAVSIVWALITAIISQFDR